MIWIILIVVLICIVAFLAKAGGEDAEDIKYKEIMRKYEKKKEEEAKDIQYNQKVDEQNQQYGVPDKRISLAKADISKEVVVWGDAKMIYILGEIYNFSDIVGCSLDDNYRIKKGAVTYTSNTKNNTGSTLGRAVVGGLVAGGAGAVIGGATAKKETSTISKMVDDTLIHDYVININVNSFKTPVIRINTKNDGVLTNEIMGLLNLVIKSNQ